MLILMELMWCYRAFCIYLCIVFVSPGLSACSKVSPGTWWPDSHKHSAGLHPALFCRHIKHILKPLLCSYLYFVFVLAKLIPAHWSVLVFVFAFCICICKVGTYEVVLSLLTGPACKIGHLLTSTPSGKQSVGFSKNKIFPFEKKISC